MAKGIIWTSQTLSWRKRFASIALSIWSNHGDVDFKCVFGLRPRTEWNWAEGDDPRISWVDFTPFSLNCRRVAVGQKLLTKSAKELVFK
jgi:hypothetical protein